MPSFREGEVLCSFFFFSGQRGGRAWIQAFAQLNEERNSKIDYTDTTRLDAAVRTVLSTTSKSSNPKPRRGRPSHGSRRSSSAARCLASGIAVVVVVGAGTVVVAMVGVVVVVVVVIVVVLVECERQREWRRKS